MVIQAHKKLNGNVESQSISEDVIRCAGNILQEIENSFVQKLQHSFFLQECDLMLHSIDKDDYRQMLYVMYCAAVLSDTNEIAWQQLAEYVAQQPRKPENKHDNCFFLEIKTLVDMGLKSQMNKILIDMVQLGQVEGVRMMLERGVSLTDKTFRMMILACNRIKDYHHRDDTRMLNFLENNVKGKLACIYSN